MDIKQNNLFNFLEKYRSGKVLVIFLEIIGISVTIFEFHGILTKGLKFLGRFALNPSRLQSSVWGISIFVWLVCGYVLFWPNKSEPFWKNPKNILNNNHQIIAIVVIITNIIGVSVLFSTILRYDTVEASDASDISILVATFGKGPEINSSPKGREMTAFITRSLRREIERSSYQTTILSGPRIQSEKEALKVGLERDVDIVLWGWVTNTDDETLLPTFTFIETDCGQTTVGQLPLINTLEIEQGSRKEKSYILARRATPLINYILGLLHINNGDLSQARLAFNQAVDQTNDELENADDIDQDIVEDSLAYYYLALGRIDAMEKNYQDAVKNYETAKEIQPEFWPVYLGLGNVSYQNYECEEAFKYFQKAVEINPTVSSIWYSMGNAKFCSGEHSEANEYYREAIALVDDCETDKGTYYFVLGISNCRLGNIEEGLDWLHKSMPLVVGLEELSKAVDSEINTCRGLAEDKDQGSRNQINTSITPTNTATIIPVKTSTIEKATETLTITPTQTSTFVYVTSTPIQDNNKNNTPSPSETPEPILIQTPTEELPTPDSSPTTSSTKTPSLTHTLVSSSTVSPIPTNSPTHTYTPPATPTITNTPGPTNTSTFTPTPSYTPSETPTLLPTAKVTPP